MNTEQTNQIVEQIARLFPNWRPAADESLIWHEEISRLNDLGAVKLAVSGLYKKTRYNKPNFSDFLELYRQHSNFEGTVEGGAQFTRYYILCAEPAQNHPGRAGWFCPVWSDENYDRWHDIAEKMRRHHQEFYHGTWQVVNFTMSHPTATQIELDAIMTKRRIELYRQFNPLTNRSFGKKGLTPLNQATADTPNLQQKQAPEAQSMLNPTPW